LNKQGHLINHKKTQLTTNIN